MGYVLTGTPPCVTSATLRSTAHTVGTKNALTLSKNTLAATTTHLERLTRDGVTKRVALHRQTQKSPSSISHATCQGLGAMILTGPMSPLRADAQACCLCP